MAPHNRRSRREQVKAGLRICQLAGHGAPLLGGNGARPRGGQRRDQPGRSLFPGRVGSDARTRRARPLSRRHG